MFSTIRKTIVAAITGLATIGALATDDNGVTDADKFAIAGIVLGVVLVYFTPNGENTKGEDTEQVSDDHDNDEGTTVTDEQPATVVDEVITPADETAATEGLPPGAGVHGQDV